MDLLEYSLRPATASDAAAALAAAQAAQATVDGLTWKKAVRCATTGNITLSGTQTIDGVSAIAGDRVLVRLQTAGAENGIYVVASGAWSRSTDADVSAEVTSGLSVRVTEGAVHAGKGFWLATTGAIVLGTTALVFEPFAGNYRYRRINAQTGTTYTFALDDADGNTLVTLSNASAIAATIPANASVPFPVGSVISCMVIGAGQVTYGITTDTLNNPGLTAKSRAQWSMQALTKISSTVWVISGDLAVV